MRCKTREVGGRLGSEQSLLAGKITCRLTDGNLWGIVEEYGERAIEEAGPHAQSARIVSGFRVHSVDGVVVPRSHLIADEALPVMFILTGDNVTLFVRKQT